MLFVCQSNSSIGIGSLMGRRGRMIVVFEGVWVVVMCMEEDSSDVAVMDWILN